MFSYLNQKLLFLSFVFLFLLGISSPLIMALGATGIHFFSLFEFYLIDLIVRPPGLILAEDETIFGAFVGHITGEIKSIFGLGASYLPWLGWFVPLLVVAFIFPTNMAMLPINLLLFGRALAIGYVVTLLLSMLLRVPLYRYLRIRAMFNSVAFALITSLAASYMHTHPLIACVLYAVSFLPLSYFAGNMFGKRYYLENKTSVKLEKFGYVVGSLSIVYHILEIVLHIVAVYFRLPLLIRAAKFLTCNEAQGLLLFTTTSVSSLSIVDRVSDAMSFKAPEKEGLVDPKLLEDLGSSKLGNDGIASLLRQMMPI